MSPFGAQLRNMNISPTTINTCVKKHTITMAFTKSIFTSSKSSMETFKQYVNPVQI